MWFGTETVPIVFRRRAEIADPTGGTTRGDYIDAFTRQGSVREVTGREIAEGGRSEDSIDCIVRVRDDSTTRTITLADRAVLRGQNFDIITVGLPNRSAGSIEMTLRRQLGGQ